MGKRSTMARLPRFAVAGQPHLVIQQANGSRPIFLDDVDRAVYVDAMVGAANSCAVAVHAYVLLNDQVCLLVTPREAEGLGRFMQRIGRRYVAEFHRRHATSGPLWAGRFQSTAIDPEHYLLPSIRFIEDAPVRSGVAALAKDWPWSSAQHHLGRRRLPWITEHSAYWRLGNTPFEREAKHEIALGQMLDTATFDELEAAARRGWPLGGHAFVATIAKTTERPMQPRPRGRPRRISTLT
jgi:putative transposase